MFWRFASNRAGRRAKYLVGAYPSARLFQFSGPITADTTLINQGVNPDSPNDYQVPHWLTDREFSGLAIDDTQPDPRIARLYIRSFVSSDIRPDLQFNLQVSVPFDHYFLGRLKAALGLDLMLAERVERAGLMLQSADLVRDNVIETTFESTQSPASPYGQFLFQPYGLQAWRQFRGLSC
jgi:hypothetical protein